MSSQRAERVDGDQGDRQQGESEESEPGAKTRGQGQVGEARHALVIGLTSVKLDKTALTTARKPSPEENRPVGDAETRCPRGPVTNQAARRSAIHPLCIVVRRPHGYRRHHHRHRAARVARARRGRGRPAEVERRVAQAAKLLGRDMRVPGFRPGKVPPPVVIQRVGREAVLDEAVRESLGGWYRRRSTTRASSPIGEPDLDLGEPARRGRAADVLDRDRRAPEGRARRVQGPRGREARARRRRTRRSTRSSSSCASARPARDRRAPGPARRLRRHGLRRLRRRRAVRRRRGPRPDDRARLGPPRRPASRSSSRARRPARSARSRSPSPRTTATELAGKEAVFAVTVKEVKAKQLPELDDDFAVEAGLRHARRAARGHPRAPRRDRGAAHRGRVPRGRAGRRRRQRDRRGARRARRGPRARAVGRRCSTRSRTRASTARPTCRSPARPRTRSIEEAKPDAERRCAARPCWPRSSRPSASSPPTRSCSRRSPRRRPRARQPEKLLERLRKTGRLDSLKEDLAQRKAIDLVAESAKPVPATASDS